MVSKMLYVTVLVIPLGSLLAFTPGGQSCVGPRRFGFSACPPHEGLTSVSVKQLSVYSDEECVRECTNTPGCESVNVRIGPSASTLRDCELFDHQDDCDKLNPKSGYRYFKKLPGLCLTKATDVKAAVFMGDRTYWLFFESTVQTFRLSGQSLAAVDCPVELIEYFYHWSSSWDVKGVFRSDVRVITQPIYVIHDNKVEQYLVKPTAAYPSTFPPWPVSIPYLLGAGVPENVTAVFTHGDMLYSCTADNLYASHFRLQETESMNVTSGFSSPEFSWSDVTAAAMDTGTDILILFTGNTYFLYDVNDSTVISRGTVCTNL